MKYFNKYLGALIFSFFLFSVGYGQNLAVTHNPISGTNLQNPNDLVIIHYDGDNAGNSVGDGGTTFIGGARFRASIMGTYNGYLLKYVQFFYSQAATGLTIMIYDAGTSTDPGTLLLSQTLDIASLTLGDWNQVELSSYIPISGNDIWVCLQVEDATGASYPFGVDAGPADPDGDFVNDSGVWQHLNDFGLNYNWNIRAVIDSPGPVIFSENFDALTAGGQVACQDPTNWTTWSNLPCDATEDAYVSNTYSYSSPNSAVIVQNNDLVHVIDNYTSGKYQISFYNYIPSGKTGYFNTLALFSGSSSQWGLEVYFNAGGAGSINAGGTGTATFTYTFDAWEENIVVVDLDNDYAEYWYGGNMIYSWQWTLGASGTPIPDQLGGNDFFGAAATDEMYFDDYMVSLYVPVELTSFTGAAQDDNVVLNWSTATETNNRGFEIQRKTAGNDFLTIGSVNGQGTSTQSHSYSYVDSKVAPGTYSYRLKQVDFDGTSSYSNLVEVKVTAPLNFGLDQNYPNPFNPTTNINFSLVKSGFAKLVVYNILGQEVRVLVNGYKDAGRYTINFNAVNLPSGTYIYKLQSGNSVSVKKMMLLK
jgi:hypothetical protein